MSRLTLTLWTDDHNVAFYERQGWAYLPDIQVMIGDKNDPHQSEGCVLMVFVSDIAKSNRQKFIDAPVYFGKHSW